MNEEKKLDEKTLEGVSGGDVYGDLGIHFHPTDYRCPKCKDVFHYDIDLPYLPVCPRCNVDLERTD